MPPKQRTRTRAEIRSRQKHIKEGSSSNEEMDSCSAQEIVNRLASKYLLKSSTDTDNEKENNRRTKPFDPYDADLEYSTTDMESDCRVSGSQTSASEMETNSRNGHSQMKKNKRGQKKPVQRKNTKEKKSTQTKTKPKKTLQSGLTKNQGKTQRKKLLGQSTGSNTESTTQSQTSDTSDSTSREAERTSKVDKKSEKRSVSFSQQPSMECEGIALSASVQSQPGDSGFYVTPPGKSAPFCVLPQLSASDTSTPASAKSGKLQLDDSCFGFENIVSPEPLLISPVNRVSPTPTASSSFESTSKEPSFQSSSMDASSVLGSTAGRSRKKRPFDNDANRLFDNTNCQPKKVKRTKAKPKKEFVNWEAVMSAEFEDVEMHELTIES